MTEVQPARHFYLSDEVSWDNLKSLQDRYAQGYVTVYTNRHAWGSILRVYLPSRYDPSQIQPQPGRTAQGTKYCVLEHHSDQGPPEIDHGVGGSVTVHRIIADLPARTKHNRDILYVKCSPPSDIDSQSQWNSAMQAAVARLGQKYPNLALFFILGVGMAWLPFYWDPQSPAPAGQALRMVANGAAGEGEGEGASGWCEVSPEVRAPPGIDAGHVDGQGIVRTDRPRSLDCFTVSPQRKAGEVPSLAYQKDLDFLEEFIRVVETHTYVGENDLNLD